jgi:hypothetical protein
VRQKLENHGPGLQGVLLLLVLLTTSTGRLVRRLAVPCFRYETQPASDVGISIAFHLSLARGIKQLDPRALMKEDVLFHTQFMKLGCTILSGRSWRTRRPQHGTSFDASFWRCIFDDVDDPGHLGSRPHQRSEIGNVRTRSARPLPPVRKADVLFYPSCSGRACRKLGNCNRRYWHYRGC